MQDKKLEAGLTLSTAERGKVVDRRGSGSCHDHTLSSFFCNDTTPPSLPFPRSFFGASLRRRIDLFSSAAGFCLVSSPDDEWPLVYKCLIQGSIQFPPTIRYRSVRLLIWSAGRDLLLHLFPLESEPGKGRVLGFRSVYGDL